MRGTRIDPSPDGCHACPPGGYFKDAHGHWHGVTPNDLGCNLTRHKVVEHEDGTITVSPSILVSKGWEGKEWHGFLERGVWREC